MNYRLRSYVLKKFTKEQDEQLVECVFEYPSIYNPQNRDYKLLYIRELSNFLKIVSLPWIFTYYSLNIFS